MSCKELSNHCLWRILSSVQISSVDYLNEWNVVLAEIIKFIFLMITSQEKTCLVVFVMNFVTNLCHYCMYGTEMLVCNNYLWESDFKTIIDAMSVNDMFFMIEVQFRQVCSISWVLLSYAENLYGICVPILWDA